ncbi:hypothetical protein SAMN05428936_11811 [Pelagibacterium halotolerans]|nr:hypothetical protein SAMN05428936_11811 [Pelagibacterium halotolerans]
MFRDAHGLDCYAHASCFRFIDHSGQLQWEIQVSIAKQLPSPYNQRVGIPKCLVYLRFQFSLNLRPYQTCGNEICYPDGKSG